MFYWDYQKPHLTVVWVSSNHKYFITNINYGIIIFCEIIQYKCDQLILDNISLNCVKFKVKKVTTFFSFRTTQVLPPIIIVIYC